jgi:1-acyl-sn-glycerol-3-phosphate acyltransferase
MSRWEFARRVPGRPALQILWFDVGEILCRATLRLLYGFRVVGRERIPPSGPVLFASNHQSFLDPVLNGIAVRDRQLTAIARIGLFKFRPFAWLMKSYGAISIKEDSGDVEAMKAALSELAAGRCILIYPEGSRSDDGRVSPFKRGIGLLLRRAKVPVVPMAIEGATDVWPPSRSRPSLRGGLAVEVGEPIAPDELLRGGVEAGLDRLRAEIDRLRCVARARIRERTHGRWPSRGLADEPLTTPAAPAAPDASA